MPPETAGLQQYLCQFVVVRSHEGVAEILGMFSEGLVVNPIDKRVQVLDDERRCRVRIAFRELENPLYAGCGLGDVIRDLAHRQSPYTRSLFSVEVIVYSPSDCVP